MQFVIGYLVIYAIGLVLLWLWTVITDHKIQIVSFFTSFFSNAGRIILCFIFICVLYGLISSILKKLKKFLDNITTRKEEKLKIDNLYNKAVEFKDKKQYQHTLNIIDEAVKLSKKQGFDVTRFDYIKDEILDLIEKTKQEATEKVNKLYHESLTYKCSKNYKLALDHIAKALKIAQESSLDTSRINKLKDELTKQVNNISTAEKDFKSALQAYKNKDYVSAINKLENAIKLIPDNSKYQTRLKSYKNEYQQALAQADNYYNKAKNLFENNDFEKATIEINRALKLMQDNKYVKLKKDIKDKQLKFQDEQKAEKLYTEALDVYTSNSTNYDRILKLLNKAITLSPKKEYKGMLAKVKKESDFITAEKLYEEAKEYFNNKDYDRALSSIKQAVKLDPSNRMYIDLKQKIDWEQKESEKRKVADEYFKEGIQALQDGNFAEAIEYLEEVQNLQPNNAECKTLLDKARTGKIDITDCSKKALLSLDFINEEQAENIIQSRNEGMMWFDYQKFAEQFGIMLYLWADVEEKIEFPLKQANKYGRRLDW